MDVKDIKSLIKMITETDISEFEMESAKEKIRIKRGSQPEIIQYQVPQAPMQQSPMLLPQQHLPAPRKPLEALLPHLKRGKPSPLPLSGPFIALRRLTLLRMWRLGRSWKKDRCFALSRR